MGAFVYRLRFAWHWQQCTVLHCVSKKNIPDVFSYNSRKHRWIFI